MIAYNVIRYLYVYIWIKEGEIRIRILKIREWDYKGYQYVGNINPLYILRCEGIIKMRLTVDSEM